MVKDFQTKQKMFRAPFSFKGRIRRREYWLSISILWAVLVLLAFLLETMEELLDLEPGSLALLFLLLFIPCIWFAYAQGVKRCHDIGKSGWHLFLPTSILVYFEDGEEYENDYGPDPKGRDLFADVYEKDEDK